jgi:hypothetical protein
MNERDFERTLGEWLKEPRPSASAWVLENVIEHAHQRSNQSWWRGRAWPSVPGVAFGPGPRASGRPMVGITAAAASVVAMVLAISLVLPGLTPDADRHPVMLPPSSLAPSAPTPDASEEPTVAAAPTGSVWLAESAEGLDSYLTLHPDGTVTQRVNGSGTPVGLGLWRPTGEHSLASVMVFLDADPAKHLKYGSSTYRADWVLDETDGSGSLTWTATARPGDGSAPFEASGELKLTRQHQAPLPAEARYPLPDISEWRLGTSLMGSMRVPGTVSAIENLDYCDGNGEEYMVAHGDGTLFFAGQGGSGVGLWIDSGPGTTAVTAWSESFGLNTPTRPWVGERTAGLVLAGDQDVLDRRLSAVPLGIEQMDGRPLPEVDDGLWPPSGSVWLETTDQGMSVNAFLRDGTVVSRHSRYGTGAGYWRPVDADTIAYSVAYALVSLQDQHIRGEATIAADGSTMSIEYQHVDRNRDLDETGEASATRLYLDK